MSASNAPSAGEYIGHHLKHLQNKEMSGVIDFSVFNIDSIFWGIFLGVVDSFLLWKAASKATTLNSGTAVFGFLLWEMVKIGLTIAMLYAAIWLVKDLSWPAMLVGLVVTMKVYWVVFAWRKVFHPVA